MIATPGNHEFTAQFAEDVLRGLRVAGQKELPSKYLYDAVGSRLFDVITELPEYGLTRAETRLLKQHGTELAARLPLRTAVAELMMTVRPRATAARGSKSVPASGNPSLVGIRTARSVHARRSASPAGTRARSRNASMLALLVETRILF